LDLNECVARALAKADGLNPDEIAEGADTPLWESYEKEARHHIAASQAIHSWHYAVN